MPHVKGYKAGASLRMWRDYFPNAEILGIDINVNATKEARGERIVTDTGYGGLIGKHFDFIVDDGNHDPQSQIERFKELRIRLQPEGLYIIEDVERYALEQNLLSPHLPEHTVIQHHHGKEVGRCILIRG